MRLDRRAHAGAVKRFGGSTETHRGFNLESGGIQLVPASRLYPASRVYAQKRGNSAGVGRHPLEVSMLHPVNMLCLTLFACILAASPSFATAPEEREGRMYCGDQVVEGLDLSKGAAEPHSSASRDALAAVDAGYKTLLEEDALRGPVARSADVQCRLDALRIRARELEGLRASLAAAASDARNALEREEQVAGSLCVLYEFGGREWLRCEEAAARTRAKLRSAATKAERVWRPVSEAPDFGSDSTLGFWVEPRVARASLIESEFDDRSLLPKSIGPEVWCGRSRMRGVSTLLSSETEFARELERERRADRNIRIYEERLEQALSSELHAIDQAQGAVRSRRLRSRVEKIDDLRNRLATWRCQQAWARTRTRELQAVPSHVELAFEKAQDDLDGVEATCAGLRQAAPNQVATDDGSESWIACQARMRDKRHLLEQELNQKGRVYASMQAALAEHEVWRATRQQGGQFPASLASMTGSVDAATGR